MQTRIFRALSLIGVLALLALGSMQTPAVEAQTSRGVGAQANFPIYLPLIQKACSTGQTYSAGVAYRSDQDVPQRPAYNHADKNLALRSYAIDNTSPKQIAAYYAYSAPAPKLRNLFMDNRLPNVLNVYDVYDWNWATSPSPGTRSSNPVNVLWPVTVAGLQVTPGETIRTPSYVQTLGAGVAAIVLYADPTRITIHYTRDDGVGRPPWKTSAGYSIHIENICVDANLLALYNSLETAGRYTQTSYNLVTLTPLQPIGTAISGELPVVIRDNGGFMDPRSLNDWWLP